ncbi:unnamed protein product [Clonostachys rosea f. rosea IK726]|uniref:Uncharacterized protein n=2 Tax=Bionectria ochroleuca TaxID=29856 RepID=A0A0B7KDI1_BIOOC|nr:unnamed protein product [Clonostachys rosea f. rosea IK726]
MSAPLSNSEEKKFAAIIDAILETADLETISQRKVRQALEGRLGGRDLSDQKDAIKDLIQTRFEARLSQDAQEDEDSETKKRSSTNGTSRYDDDANTDASASPEPARKKVKRSSSAEDADARLAAQLQAQENSLARSRSTRGGGTDKKAVKKKKAPRKKSAKKVKSEDDSDVEGGEPKKKRSGGGFQKPFNLSPALSELTGETQLSRPGVVKSLWAHIKANDLQDPNDRRQILCDEKMQAIFKQTKVDMFRMNKEISNHLYPVEEA